MNLLFPLRRDKKSDFANAAPTDAERIAAQMHFVLSTVEGELELDTALGSRLHLLRHRNMRNDQGEAAALASYYIRAPLARFVPEARVTEVAVVPLSGGNGNRISISFVPIDRAGRVIGAERNVTIGAEE